ncbi:MAG: GGDEF domain-containing protein [Novosphingobium sp.]
MSTRTAFLLGTVVLVFKLAFGFYPMGAGLALGNVAVRFAGIGIVLVFIGLARKSCEREWRLARADLLTGALNRQAFFELAGSGRCSGGWSALIYADLDGLKQLNDRKGHGWGDKSLKVFTETVRHTIREGDVLARMGGDEFVIFMKLRDEAAGQAVARRLHQALNVDGKDDPLRLKCSLGVLVLPDGLQSIDAELRAADELMYKAKQSRSGVAVATGVATGGRITLALREPALAHETQVRQSDRPVEALPQSPRAAA